MRHLRLIPILLSGLILSAPLPLFAADEHGMHHAAGDSTADLSDGEVRKIDKEAGKITLKHGEIKNLQMPGMTMAFLVKDKALLEKVQAGDKVKFRAVSENGRLVVTQLRLAR